MLIPSDFEGFVCVRSAGRTRVLLLLCAGLLLGCSSSKGGGNLSVDGAGPDGPGDGMTGDPAVDAQVLPPDVVLDTGGEDGPGIDVPTPEVAEGDVQPHDLPLDVFDSAGQEVLDSVVPEDSCVPVCAGECGPDGCGGSCGECPDGAVCEDGACKKLPVPCVSSKECAVDEVCDKEKGVCVECLVDDDCGPDSMCSAAGTCVPAIPCESDKTCKELQMVCDKEKGVCVECLTDPDCPASGYCDEQVCHPDVCQAGDLLCQAGDVWGCAPNGGSFVLVTPCSDTDYCLNGACHAKVCEPSSPYCDGMTALVCDDLGSGPVGPGVECDPMEEVCEEGGCVCIPDCCQSFQLQCGLWDDGCGNPMDCGACSKALTCVDGVCLCIPDCKDKVCGGNGCEGSCGTCPEGKSCVDGKCVCIPLSCAEAKVECGVAPDGCGAFMDCGGCPIVNFSCFNGMCMCVPTCAGKECGDNGCAGTCGTCKQGYACSNGMCGLVCGDGLCIEPENRCNCPLDCGACTGCCSAGACLNGTANLACGSGGAACTACPAGMSCTNQACTFVCGDKTCSVEGGESCVTCPADCGQCPVTPGFVLVKAGSFWMGSPSGAACPAGYTGGGCNGSGTGNTVAEHGRDSDETLHQVTLTRDFEIMDLLVTQKDWKGAFGGWNPSASAYTCGDSCPVESVTWYSALAYANWRSAQAGLTPCYQLSNVVCVSGTSVGSQYMTCMTAGGMGISSATVMLAAGAVKPYDCKGYRLPMEAEWELAARAGTLTPFYDGQGIDSGHASCEVPFHLTSIAWYCGNATSTKPVGGKTANAWGLRDMSGNVWEYCWDWRGTYAAPYTDPDSGYSGSDGYRVRRGGGWDSFSRHCRSANRGGAYPNYASSFEGFRLARTL
ncbi:MAG: formylglycine-generating enzyme family protein [Deltaproteobacteria bacterium]|nr:formylglycine-generating enzyme family protein [Deltaproteobacteria bacterium]